MPKAVYVPKHMIDAAIDNSSYDLLRYHSHSKLLDVRSECIERLRQRGALVPYLDTKYN